jgi:uncharacterized protein (DUF1330 family)
MAVYFIARLDIKDAGRYEDYLSGFDAAFEGRGGQVLAVDDGAEVLEGRPSPGRSVIISFPDEETFHAWYDSPAYRSLLAIRKAAAEGPVILVHGRPRVEGS